MRPSLPFLLTGVFGLASLVIACGGKPDGETATVASALAAAVVASGSIGVAPGSWNQLPATGALPARGYAMMSYLPHAHQMIVFGGQNAEGVLNDSWVSSDGVTWKNLAGSAPPARAAGCMTYDAPSEQIVLFGGTNGEAYFADTWLFDEGTRTWRQAFPAQPMQASIGCSAFPDPLDGHADVYGGYIGQFYELSTYQWTGSNWNKLPIDDQHSATARDFAMSGVDIADGNVVIFGGMGDVNPDNTWIFDGTTYANVTPPVQPALRYGALGAFEPGLGGILTFGGGEAATGDLDDTWLWTGSAWSQLQPTASPSAREGYGLIYDPDLGHVILFGGQRGLMGAHDFHNDVWEFVP
jgi:hypothetical protein